MEIKDNDNLARIAIFRGFQVDGVLMLKNLFVFQGRLLKKKQHFEVKQKPFKKTGENARI